MSALKIKDDQGNWINLPGLKGDKGDKGDKGESGVYLGTTAPSDEDINVWINPNGEAHTEAVVVDDTLTQEGQAADAKKTGDKIAGLKEDLDVVNDAVGLITGSKAITFTKGGRIDTSGNLGTIIDLVPISSDSYSYAIVDCSESDEFILNCEGAGTSRPWVFINSSNALIKYSPVYTSGTNAYVVAPSGASKLIVNSKNTALGNCINGINLKDSVDNLWSRVETEHIISTSDLIQQNTNFVIQNDNISVVSKTRPFNSLLIKSSKIEFDFARVDTSISLYIGVAIGGHFVGNQTRTVVADIREIYDEANNEFTGATLNISTGDENYSNTPAHFTAEINGNVFTLKKGDTIIFRFTVSPLYAVDGIAILNYNLTTIQNCFVVNNLAQDGINDVYKIVNRADIIGLQSNHRMIAGVIRNSGSGWEFIINDRHQGDMNCVSVGISEVDGRLYVDYSGINAKKVIFAIFAPDEDFASRGFFIGASVGLDKAYPEIYQNTLNAVYGIIEYNASTEVFDVSNSEGITSAVWGSDNMLTITHNQIVSGAMIPCVAIYGYGRYIPGIYSFSDTTTKIRFFNANANTGVTTPDGYMKIVFGRFDPVLRRTKIDPATLVSESGNIWFTGIFEV